MKHIAFYLDVISPYACLAFERMPEAIERLLWLRRAHGIPIDLPPPTAMGCDGRRG